MHYGFQRWSRAAKLRFTASLCIGCLFGLATWQGFDTEYRSDTDRQNATRNTVGVTHGIVRCAHGPETSGQMSHEGAQAMTKTLPTWNRPQRP